MKRLLSWFVLSAVVLSTFPAGAFAAPNVADAVTPGSVVLSEVMANAKDEDTGEFIELYNPGDTAVDLSRYVLSDLVDTADVLRVYTGSFSLGQSSLVLAPNGFALVVDPEYNGEYNDVITNNADLSTFIMLMLDDTTLGNGLGNSSDAITLKDGSANIVATHSWGHDMGDGISESALGLGVIPTAPVWGKSAHLFGSTPGFANNVAPVAAVSVDVVSGAAPLVVHFDASDSVDPELQPLVFQWSFGDGAEAAGSPTQSHTYALVGTYAAVLTVTDSEGSLVTALHDIVVSEPVPTPPPVPPVVCSLRVSEILPNPVGDDTEGEYIEVENTGVSACDLAGYKLDDVEGGSQPFVLPALSLPSNEFHAFYRPETNIALNNNDESARILDAAGHAIDTLAFTGSAPEGTSFARNASGEGEWTVALTPGLKNIIKGKTNDPTTPPGTVPPSQTSAPAVLSIKDARGKKLGDEVAVEGYVTVVPGILSPSYFYLQSEGAGIQVYNSAKTFPRLTLGAHIRVVGTLSRAYNEMRILTHEVGDVTELGGNKVVTPQRISAKQVGSSLAGVLVSVVGRVVRKDGSSIYIQDATGEAKIVLDADTTAKSALFQKLATVSVTGVLTNSESGLRVVPRSASDVTTGKALGTLAKTGFDFTDPLLYGLALGTALIFTSILQRRKIRARMSHYAERYFSSSPLR